MSTPEQSVHFPKYPPINEAEIPECNYCESPATRIQYILGYVCQAPVNEKGIVDWDKAEQLYIDENDYGDNIYLCDEHEDS